MCDMVTGSLDRIINSGRFPLLLWRLGVTRYIIWKQKASYLVTTQVGWFIAQHTVMMESPLLPLDREQGAV